MSDFQLSITPMPLAEWPEEQLQRIWRLTTGAIRTLALAGENDAEARIAQLEPQAAALGSEMMRRGLL